MYVLRDADTGEFLKVGKTEVANFGERFRFYEDAANYTGRRLEVDTYAFHAEGFKPQVIEDQIRQNLVGQGRSLPWDNTKIGNAGRLGRPGPGVPGTRLLRRLRDEGWRWEGENLVRY